MPFTSSLGVNSNKLIASKHLLTCLYTNVGSLVYASISNNWSSDKKKNLGNALRLVSKYSESDF